jgi:uncharacterized phage infection (PIP) family protein YhgE
METIFEAAFVAGFAVVAVSFVLVIGRWIPDRVLLALTGVLAVAATAALVALGLNARDAFADSDPLTLAAAGLLAAAVAEAGLYALSRGLAAIREQEELIQSGRQHIEALIDQHAAEQAAALDRTLQRERANAGHALSQQERKLTLERRDLVARQADRARAELAGSIEQIQEQLEQRLTAWAADLDRGQRGLETRLNALAQRQAEAIKAYEARLAADSEYLRTATEEQQTALARLRAELEQVGRDAFEAGQAEIEVYAEESRRALQEIALRLREQERNIREQVEREEADAITRIQSSFEDIERRQRAGLDRALERATQRLVEEAERRFDVQIRQSREKSAQRLSHELEKAMQQFAHRAEKEIADRIDEAATAAATRLERRIGDITRAAEAQHEIAAERLRQMGERLAEALAQAEERELQVSAKLERLEQTARSDG